MAFKSRPKYLRLVGRYRTIAAVQQTVSEYNTLPLARSRVGSDMPMYKLVIAKHQNAVNTLSASKQEANLVKGKLTVKKISGSGKGNIGWSDFCGLYLANVERHSKNVESLKANALNQAAIVARNKVRDQTQNISGLTFLGELRDTIHLIKHPAEAAFKLTDIYLKDLKRKRKRMTKRQFRDTLANTWLEYSFGVKPLMNDIQSIAEALLYQVTDERYVRIRAVGVDGESNSDTLTKAVTGLPMYFQYNRDIRIEAKHVFYLEYKYKETEAIHPVRQLFNQSFTALDIIPTAWELLPWSFFIDYFSNIGDVIGTSLVSLENVQWVGSTSVVTDTLVMHSGSPLPTAGVEILGWSSPTLVATNKTVERSPSSLPFGEVRFELPGKENQFKNMAALFSLMSKI